MHDFRPKKPVAKRTRRFLAAACMGILLLVAFISREPLKVAIKTTEPWRTGYFWYFNARYPWKSAGQAGHGDDARKIYLQDPVGLGQGSDVTIFVSDRGRFIWSIDQRGLARVIAGSGRYGFPKPGTPAIEAAFVMPEGLCVDRVGRILVADSSNHAIFQIDTDGIIRTVAGTGRAGYSGDNGSAGDASLHGPTDVAVDSTGAIYVADTGNHCVRRIGPQGDITTVAGDGTAGFGGDGGLAAESRLNTPYGIAVDSQDRLYIADSLNHVVRRIDFDGNIRTVVGSGQPGFSGDGGPAANAELDAPQSLAIDEAGRLLIGDEHNHRVRLVDSSGIITTLAGSGDAGFDGDGGPGYQARLNDPEGVLFRRDGSILIADGDNGRVRIVDEHGTIETFAGYRPDK